MDLLVVDAGSSLLFMSLLSVVLFCGCCSMFLREITKPLPFINQTGYARSALQVSKTYKIFSWGSLTAFFLVGLVMSFIEVFARL